MSSHLNYRWLIPPAACLQIPGMPETVDIAIDTNTTLAEDVIVPWPMGPSGTTHGANSVLQTRGKLGLRVPLLPEYMVEPVGPSRPSVPSDHAADVAEEVAQKIAEGQREPRGLRISDTANPTFAEAALQSVTKHVQGNEELSLLRPANAPRRLDPIKVPNLWLAVAHSDSLQPGHIRKVEVDGVPIALWRSAAGEVSAVSDVCIHRGASLARGWVRADRLVCPCELAGRGLTLCDCR